MPIDEPSGYEHDIDSQLVFIEKDSPGLSIRRSSTYSSFTFSELIRRPTNRS